MNKRVLEWLNRDWKALMAEKMEAGNEWAAEARKMVSRRVSFSFLYPDLASCADWGS